MKARWTSEDIWFIHLDKTVEHSDEIPLRAFVSFPFETQFQEAPGEFYSENKYLHCYLRILYLSIILLEIGLGQPLSIERSSAHSLAGHINLALRMARKRLKDLRNADWDGFQYKDYYVKAVRKCLEPINFTHTMTRSESPLEERRKALLRNIVTPLSWLATVGFDASDEILRVPIRKKVRRQSTFADNDELQKFWRDKHIVPSFCSGGTTNTQDYLADLQAIAGHI